MLPLFVQMFQHPGLLVEQRGEAVGVADDKWIDELCFDGVQLGFEVGNVGSMGDHGRQDAACIARDFLG